jgi:DNA-binding transcriptional ArsR family regulator
VHNICAIYAAFMAEPSRVHLDAESLKVLAHPLRARLLGLLRLDGPATATGLAGRLGTNSGATSYHLRKLASVGLVAELPEEGDGRDRWWRAAHDMTSWNERPFTDDPDTAQAAEWLAGFGLRMSVRRLEDWMEARSDWDAEWRDASDMSDYMLELTPAEAAGLAEELHSVIQRHVPAPGARAGTRQIIVQLQLFPRVDRP